MGRKIKKGTRGTAAQHLSRGSALKKLQISLADFRRLCILKGIYPRDPKKKPKGKDKTYYHMKDIMYLQHEPLLQKFRDIRVFERKYKRALGRRETSVARNLEGRRPVYGLYHLVQERYRTLLDAVRDLDDALSTLALFSSLGADDERGVPAEVIAESARLFDEVLLFIAEKRLVRKVFCSIKGFYIQIKYLGEPVTFLIPHQFPQELPPEVDFKVYHMAGWVYPPQTNHALAKAGCRFLSLTVQPLDSSNNGTADVSATPIHAKLESLQKKLSRKGIDPDQEQTVDASSSCSDVSKSDELDRENLTQRVVGELSDDDDANEDEAEAVAKDFETDEAVARLKSLTKQEEILQQLFSRCTFFLAREVPRMPLALMLRGCGSDRVGWQGDGSPIHEDDTSISHHVLDRPLPDHLKRYETSREFIQPQWVFDCINAGKLLSVVPYKPGATLPPHLSPFVDDITLSHAASQKVALQEISSAVLEHEKQLLAQEDEDVEDVESDERRFQEDLIAEKSKVELVEQDNSADERARRERKQAQRHQEEIDRRKALLSKKHKRLLERIEYGKNKASNKAASLQRKREQANKA